MGRILVAVDGHEHVGAATAYLIGRARRPAHGDLTDVTVVTVFPPKPDVVRGPRTSYGAERSPVSVDAARPWLEDAGTHFAFRKEVGDVTDIVDRMVAEAVFDEVVLVSDRDVRGNGLWTRPVTWCAALLTRLGMRRRTSVVVVSRAPLDRRS